MEIKKSPSITGFALVLKFQEIETGGFVCWVDYLDPEKKIAGHGPTLEECEVDFWQQRQKDDALLDFRFREEFGDSPNVCRKSISISMVRHIHLLEKTKNRMEENLDLKSYFLSFLNQHPDTQFFYSIHER